MAQFIVGLSRGKIARFYCEKRRDSAGGECGEAEEGLRRSGEVHGGGDREGAVRREEGRRVRGDGEAEGGGAGGGGDVSV